MFRNKMVLSVLFALAASIIANAAEPVARILEASGDATVQAKDKARQAEVFGTIYTDEVLALGADAKAVLGRINGELFELSGPTTIKVTSSGFEPDEGIKRIAVPAAQKPVVQKGLKSISALSKGGLTVARSGNAPVALPRVSPIQKSTVIEARPNFSWPAQPNAREYIVSVFTGVNPPIWKATVSTNSVQYGDSAGAPPTAPKVTARDLRQGIEYRWKIEAILNDDSKKVIVESSFYTASAETLAESQQLQQLNMAGNSHLMSLAAIRYEELGLFAAAIDTYEQLVAKYADRKPYWAALDELYAKAGREEDSKRARDKAK